MATAGGGAPAEVEESAEEQQKKFIVSLVRFLPSLPWLMMYADIIKHL